MKHASLLLILILTLAAAGMAAQAEWTPDRAITIVNHVALGGGMDLYTRRWVDIAEKYTDAVFEVINVTEGSGPAAGAQVLSQPADGYTVFALAPTYVDAVVQSEGAYDPAAYIDGFRYIYNLMADPYCVLVPVAPAGDNPAFDTFEDLVRWASQDGSLLTLSEPNYGAKYINAVQVFRAVGIPFEARTYGGAKKNFAALLGGDAVASVGNPGDAARYAVKALVVGAPARLPDIPDVPTFTELGYDSALDSIWMWRGYAVREGTPDEMVAWFQDLCDRISADPDWIRYMEDQLITVRTDRTEAFTRIVRQEMETTIEVLTGAGLIGGAGER